MAGCDEEEEEDQKTRESIRKKLGIQCAYAYAEVTQHAYSLERALGFHSFWGGGGIRKSKLNI